MNLELLREYAMRLIGTPYFFGGDDTMSGFDCSGFVSELLRASGLESYTFRTNAQGILNALKSRGNIMPAQLGALAFYGKSPIDVDHIAFCIDEYSMIEAGGGDGTTLNLVTAIRQNAFVRIRPVRFRRDFLFTLMPEYPVSKV